MIRRPPPGGAAANGRSCSTLLCAGAASKGSAGAGFDVIGLDIEPQPHYPYEFVRGDAIKLLSDRGFMAQFSAAHASPPCQRKSKMTVFPARCRRPPIPT